MLPFTMELAMKIYFWLSESIKTDINFDLLRSYFIRNTTRVNEHSSISRCVIKSSISNTDITPNPWPGTGLGKRLTVRTSLYDIEPVLHFKRTIVNPHNWLLNTINKWTSNTNHCLYIIFSCIYFVLILSSIEIFSEGNQKQCVVVYHRL